MMKTEKMFLKILVSISLIFFTGVSAIEKVERHELREAVEITLLTARFGHASVVDENYIYVIGGFSEKGELGDIEVIDPESGLVKVLTTDLIPRYFGTAVIHEGKIYIMGGLSNNKLEPTVEVVDIETGIVIETTQLPTPP